MTAIREAYIFVQIDGVDVVAAVIHHVRERGNTDRFYFRYGKSYLANPLAFSIDPLQLPLGEDTMIFPSLPRAVEDSGPDEFGRYLYARLKGEPTSPIDYYLHQGNLGIGTLVFSGSKTPPETEHKVLAIASIDELVDAIHAIEKKRRISPAFQDILLPGSSLGGARPKSLVKDEDGVLWIAKFNRPNDIFNIAIAEHAAMQTARKFGINTAESKLLNVAGEFVYLSKRFDRDNAIRKHFLSAYTFMGGGQFGREYSHCSYPGLSHLIKRISLDAVADRAQLFRRMVYNLVIANRDDHLKNHAFLKGESSPLYQLSPAYDIVPGAQSNLHAIGLGTEGPIASIENALSQVEAFGLSMFEAKAILDDARLAVEDMLCLLREYDMPSVEIDILRAAL